MFESDLSKKKIILFDVDGTLADTHKIHELAFKQVLIDYQFTKLNYLDYAGLSTKEVFTKLGFLGKDLVDTVEKKQAKVYELLKSVKPMPGSRELLEYLVKCNIRIAAVSSGSRRNVHQSLKTLDFLDKMEFVISAEDAEQSKPHPGPYLEGISRTKISTEFILAIEDTKEGFLSAQSAGLETIHVNKTSNNLHPYFPSLINLHSILRKIHVKVER